MAVGPAVVVDLVAEDQVTVGNETMVPSWLQSYVQPGDLEKVTEAVRVAELTTQGEIVPMVVRSSELFRGPKFFWNFLMRGLLPRAYYNRLVDVRAELEFYRHYQNRTQGHTAILLFVSMLEHRAVVLADKAIASKLPPETWDEVVRLMTSELKHKDLTSGMIKAVQKSAQILSQHFPAHPENKNELGNQLVIKE